MKSRDFCYWLQGFFELTEGQVEATEEQTQKIKNHLNMVFAHEITPEGELKDPNKIMGIRIVGKDGGAVPPYAVNC